MTNKTSVAAMRIQPFCSIGERCSRADFHSKYMFCNSLLREKVILTN